MRNACHRTELMSDAMTGAPIDASQARGCEPHRKLAVQSRFQIAWIDLIQWQTTLQQSERMRASGIRERLRPFVDWNPI